MDHVAPEQARATALALHPDSGRIAIGNDDSTIQIRDPDGRHTTLPASNQAVTVIAFSPDGSRLATSGRTLTGPLTINLTAGQASVLPGHVDSPIAVTYSVDDVDLSTPSHDRTVQVWDLATGRPTVLTGHDGQVLSAAYSPDGNHLATGSTDRTVRIWNPTTGQHTILKGSDDWIKALAYSPDSSQLACAAYGKIDLWDLTSGQRTTLEGHTGPVNAVAYSPDGTLLATGGQDTTVRIWDLVSGQHATLEGHTGPVNAVAYSPDGTLLATGGQDTTVRIWEAVSTAAVTQWKDDQTIRALTMPSNDQIWILAGTSVARLEIRRVDHEA
ncbi:WD40 repeat domain-containing protein [Actinoallomurus acanthiterrae]